MAALSSVDEFAGFAPADDEFSDFQPAHDEFGGFQSADTLSTQDPRFPAVKQAVDTGLATAQAIALPHQLDWSAAVPPEERSRQIAEAAVATRMSEEALRNTKDPAALNPAAQLVWRNMQREHELKTKQQELYADTPEGKRAAGEAMLAQLHQKWSGTEAGGAPNLAATGFSNIASGALNMAAPVADTLNMGDAAQSMRADAAGFGRTANIHQGLGADVVRGVTSVVPLVVGLPSGKVGAGQAALRAAAETYSRTLNETGDTESAHSAALKTAPEMAMFMLGGQVAGKAVGALLPKDASPMRAAIANFGGAELANVGVSNVLQAIHGEDYNAQNFSADTLFALFHGVGGYHGKVSEVARERAAAKLRSYGWSQEQIAAPFEAGAETPASMVMTAPSKVEEFGQRGEAAVTKAETPPATTSEPRGLWKGEDVGDNPIIAFRTEDGKVLMDPTARIHATAYQELGIGLKNVTPGFVIGDEFVPGSQTNPKSIQAARDRIAAKRPQPLSVHDIVPAIRVQGETVVGSKGETHAEIRDRYIDQHPEKDAGEILMEFDHPKRNPNFFVGPKGEEISRDQLEEKFGVKSSQELRRLQETQSLESPPEVSDWTSATQPQRLRPLRTAEAGATTLFGDVAKAIGKGAKALGRGIKAGAEVLTKPREMDDMRSATLGWTARHQHSADEIMRAQKEIGKVVANPIRGAGITNWIEAGGDVAELGRRAAATADPKLRKGYEAALNLSPAETAIAQKVKKAFDVLGKRAEHYDLLSNFRENYTPHIWEKAKGPQAIIGGRQLKDSMRFSKQRTFATFFEGEQAGYKPRTKDISSLLPAYMAELNSVVAAKQLVEDMAGGKGSDGRPLLAPRGVTQTVSGAKGKAHLVMPDIPAKADTGDYKVLPNNPALHDWRWTGKDEGGNPIMVNGDLALHPEAYARLKNVLGQSAIREWYNSEGSALAEIPKKLVKFADVAQSQMKATMLGMLSSFHQVQEATHAIGHKINPFFNIPKIDLRAPDQSDAVQHGLMLRPDRVSESQYMEGLGKTGLISKIPILGKIADTYASYLFHQYIPGLKMKTYEAALGRNMARFKSEMAARKIAEQEIKALTATQVNAAYGHLNYTDLGRNPTMQHLMQLGMLAPDFLEARGRFAAQGAKALLGSKFGTEQFMALGVLAATMYTASRILNKTLDGDWHFDHPFEVIVGGRKYTMRSVPEDIYNAFKDTRQFIYGRLSPLIGKGVVQGASGVNYRGEKVTSLETLGEILSQYVPLTARWIPGVKDLTQTSKNRPVSAIEELAGTLGLRIGRYSPITETYKNAVEWKKKAGKADDRGTYPTSKFQQLRYALEDADLDRAKQEYLKLVEGQRDLKKLRTGFHESLFHAFTGSEKDDAEFRRSLDAKGRALFDLATQKRQQIWQRFQGIH